MAMAITSKDLIIDGQITQKHFAKCSYSDQIQGTQSLQLTNNKLESIALLSRLLSEFKTT